MRIFVSYFVTSNFVLHVRGIIGTNKALLDVDRWKRQFNVESTHPLSVRYFFLCHKANILGGEQCLKRVRYRRRFSLSNNLGTTPYIMYGIQLTFGTGKSGSTLRPSRPVVINCIYRLVFNFQFTVPSCREKYIFFRTVP